MKQQAVFKKAEVVLEEPKTLKSILREKMLEQNLDLNLLDTVAKHVIFNVAGVMERDLTKEIKAGTTVKLMPAVKAG